MTVLARPVTPAEIVEQRARGWPDFHPEDFCHRCGGRNVRGWYVDDAVWNRVVPANAMELWQEIICPPCFTELAAERGVHDGSWRLSIDGGDHA